MSLDMDIKEFRVVSLWIFGKQETRQPNAMSWRDLHSAGGSRDEIIRYRVQRQLCFKPLRLLCFRYMTIGCTALSLILRNFAHIIKSNILAPVHTMGVDISREERYNKSLRCYQSLISIRAFLLKRQTLPGKLGQSFREMITLMENLENWNAKNGIFGRNLWY